MGLNLERGNKSKMGTGVGGKKIPYTAVPPSGIHDVRGYMLKKAAEKKQITKEGDTIDTAVRDDRMLSSLLLYSHTRTWPLGVLRERLPTLGTRVISEGLLKPLWVHFFC